MVGTRRHGLIAGFALIWACGCSAEDPSGGGRGGSGPGAGLSAAGNSIAGFGNAGSGLLADNPIQQPVGGAASGAAALAGAGGGSFCAEAMVSASRQTPVIMFVIDGSGSMCAPFNGPTRWEALRSALLDPADGVITRLEASVYFGSLLYDGTIDPFVSLLSLGGGQPVQCQGMYLDQKMTGDCPQLLDVAPALNNAAAIDAAYPAIELGGSTPTDRALNWAMDRLIEQQSTQPDVESPPQYVILATDGEPNDICVGGMGGDGSAQRAAVIAAVDRGAAANIKTFVISLAGDNPNLQAHLDEVALRGDPGNPDARTFTPDNKDQLVADIAALIGGAVGCEVFLNGEVAAGSECLGTVEVNGNPLPCCTQGMGGWTCDNQPVTQPNGWQLKSPRSIELMGDACIDFLQKSEVMLRAGFPCNVFIPD